MFPAGCNLLAYTDIVHGIHATTPSTSIPNFISLKNMAAVGVFIEITHASGADAGCAISLKQATNTGGAGNTALGFTTYYRRLDIGNTKGGAWTKVTAASNTFTADNTASRIQQYFIPVDPATLDGANSMDCMNCTIGDVANSTVTVLYLTAPKYGGNPATHTNTSVD